MSDDTPSAMITPHSVMPRAVTPLGIIAANLAELREHISTVSAIDPSFVDLLNETARLAIDLEPYLEISTTPASDTLQALAIDSAAQDWPRLYNEGRTTLKLEQEMVSGHVEGRLLNFLVRTARPQRILEIGLFTGYSALAMAEALPETGTIVALEIDTYAASVARRWFDASSHGAKIRIEVGPAASSLAKLQSDGATFDFIFIDADKANYSEYLTFILDHGLLAGGGIICVDNTLLQGDAYRSEPRTPGGAAIAAFNRTVAADARIEQVLVPIRDGVTLIRRVAA